MKCIFAIDPGTTIGLCMGELADSTCTVRFLGEIAPIRSKVKKGKKQATRSLVNIWQLRDQLEPYKESAFAIVENVHPLPGRGVVSTATFLKAVGMIEGLLVAMRIPMESVTPAVWKRRLGLNKDKSRSIVKAKQIAPRWSHKIKTHNQAEALLILYYHAQQRGWKLE